MYSVHKHIGITLEYEPKLYKQGSTFVIKPLHDTKNIVLKGLRGQKDFFLNFEPNPFSGVVSKSFNATLYKYILRKDFEEKENCKGKIYKYLLLHLEYVESSLHVLLTKSLQRLNLNIQIFIIMIYPIPIYLNIYLRIYLSIHPYI